LTIDLRRSHRLTSIRWVFGVTGRADSWRLQTSPNGTAWTDLAAYSNARSRVWQIHPASGTARYVRFLFANPNRDAKLGGLAEVEVYGTWTNGTPPATSTPFPIPTATMTPIPTSTPSPTAALTSTPDPLATPTPNATSTPTSTPTPAPSPVALQGERLGIVGGSGSGTGNWSGFARDNNLRTTWQTIASPPPQKASVYVDVGEVRSITGVEWVFRRTSGAASYAIETSTDRRTWTPMSAHAGSTPLAWQRDAFTAEARYVRFVFSNTTGAPALGYLAEIVVYGEDVAAGGIDDESLTATSTASPTVSPTPTKTPVSVTVTAVATATAEPSPSELASPEASPVAGLGT
jgi:hypothetical protein